ncbi:MAG: hypothetical protein UHH95_03000 [Oscillospiraceae bacterium]|nr:hypothetical protein [Oscillospiraceae bacterium]
MEINFKDFFLLMLRRIPVLILGLVIGFISFFAYTKVTEIPQYSCEVTMIVNAAPDTIATSGTIAASQQLTKAYIGIMKDLSFSEKIVKQLPAYINYTANDIRRSMRMEAVDDTQILSVEIITDSATDSFEIANAIEQIAPNSLRQYFDDTGSIVILNGAKKPTAPQPSNLMVNCAIGAVIGLVLSACIVLMIAKLDKRIRTEDDIRYCTNYPILGTISTVE